MLCGSRHLGKARHPTCIPTYHQNQAIQLFNAGTGGPGGSGVNFALEAATQLRQIVGPGFDIVGFDPRGMKIKSSYRILQ